MMRDGLVYDVYQCRFRLPTPQEFMNEWSRQLLDSIRMNPRAGGFVSAFQKVVDNALMVRFEMALPPGVE